MKRMSILVAALGLTLGGASLATAASGRHFALVRSSPEADATVASVDEVRLWFSQVPQEGSASVRLIDAAGEAVETGQLTSDPDDGKVVFVTVDADLPDGGYTVAWRGIGDDGHVVRGDFAFTVAAGR
jgi:copper transport protein